MYRLLFLLVLGALPLTAFADPMSAEEFDAYTRGKTLFYQQNGQSYGAEIYRENRRVTWSFLDGECKDGYWFNEGPVICFVYEDRPEDLQCWTFEERGNGLIATFEGSDDSEPLYEARDLGEEMVCLGPKIGV